MSRWRTLRLVGDHLEVWERGEAHVVPLIGELITVGRAPSNAVQLADAEASALHAILAPLAGVWTVRDLSSRNGTFINGERISSERRLRRGDEIRIGRCRLVFRGEASAEPLEATAVPERVPNVTRREHDVLVAIFGGHLPGEVFLEPATTRQVAEALHVSDAAVKQHLLHLYRKFGLTGPECTRARLAIEALRRGVINAAELRDAGQHQA
jgi:DNA-binding CsgD family transcriptional regulator